MKHPIIITIFVLLHLCAGCRTYNSFGPLGLDAQIRYEHPMQLKGDFVLEWDGWPLKGK